MQKREEHFGLHYLVPYPAGIVLHAKEETDTQEITVGLTCWSLHWKVYQVDEV